MADGPYYDDEPADDVLAAYDAGEKRVTAAAELSLADPIPHERWRSCADCHYGGCLPPGDEYQPGDGPPCPFEQCRCICRVCPLPRPEPGHRGYGSTLEASPQLFEGPARQ